MPVLHFKVSRLYPVIKQDVLELRGVCLRVGDGLSTSDVRKASEPRLGDRVKPFIKAAILLFSWDLSVPLRS
ncbi:hypothetical protein MHYP_G00336670 [Metynnis hypsauchen]